MKALGLVLIACVISSLSVGQELNKTNANGKKEGQWIVPYAKSSIVRYKGQFKNGVPYGKFVFYGPDVSKQKELVYKNENEAYAKFYDGIGLVKAEGKYVNEKRDSLWRFYDNGDLTRTEEYKNGKINGKAITFFDNARPAIIAFYKDGKKDGVELEFTKAGKIIGETNYKDSLKNGLFTKYNFDGVKELEGQYKNNILVGEITSFNKDGSIATVAEYSEGEIDTVKYVNASHEQFYEDGVMAKNVDYRNGLKNGLVKEWYPDYEWIFIEEFDKQTQKNEVYKTLKNYQVKMEGNYTQGKKNGTFKYYNPDGSLKESIVYKMGNKVTEE